MVQILLLNQQIPILHLHVPLTLDHVLYLVPLSIVAPNQLARVVTHQRLRAGNTGWRNQLHIAFVVHVGLHFLDLHFRHVSILFLRLHHRFFTELIVHDLKARRIGRVLVLM